MDHRVRGQKSTNFSQKIKNKYKTIIYEQTLLKIIQQKN